MDVFNDVCTFPVLILTPLSDPPCMLRQENDSLLELNFQADQLCCLTCLFYFFCFIAVYGDSVFVTFTLKNVFCPVFVRRYVSKDPGPLQSQNI